MPCLEPQEPRLASTPSELLLSSWMAVSNLHVISCIFYENSVASVASP